MKRTAFWKFAPTRLLGLDTWRVSSCRKRHMKRSGLLLSSRYNMVRVLIAGLILALEFGVSSQPVSAQDATVSPVSGSFTFTAINFPGGTRTRAVGLNDNGDIVGDYADASGVTHAYLLSQGTFTSFDPPGSIQTRGIAIDNPGVIGGHFLDSHKVRHSYLLNQGNFTIFDFPGATATFLQGMNARGDVVGAYNEPSGGQHGFLLSAGNFTTIDFPGAVAFTAATAINERGEIIGNYGDASGKTHGFLLSNGNFTTIDFPGAFSGTSVFGIAANRDIVGSYNDDSGLTHGFQLQQGSFSTIDFPGAGLTLAAKVSEAGQVVGFYNLAGQHGFLATPNPSAQNTLGLYDDFGQGFIDPSKWSVGAMCGGGNAYDCAREVQHGHLRLAIREYGDPNSDSGTSFAASRVMFRSPNTIDSIQLNLNVRSFISSACPANSDAAHPQFLISGTFFNTGTGDATGDVSAFFMVERRTDDLNPPGLLHVGGFMFLNGQFFNNVDLGTLQVGEGAQATLRLDRTNHAVVVRIVKSTTTPSIVEQSMPYSVPDNLPPFVPFKTIQVASFAPNCTAQRSVAAMDASIDNVRVNLLGP
jgi:probable HAF family extracellular repeat protein